jgi:Holliday junction resolvasome RuvABC ATP-dependent DNA helicase subunit
MAKEPGQEDLALRVGSVFSPAAPIREKDVFAGRRDQLRMVIDAINQQGQHALIYGERGVGKTALANVVAAFLKSMGQSALIAPHINWA